MNQLNVDKLKFRDAIMIHVTDDSKQQNRDFTFSRSLLVKYMKYFEKCLEKISEKDEIDISIHCDVLIFEWLLNYIYAVDEYGKMYGNLLSQKSASKNKSNLEHGAKTIWQSEDYKGPQIEIKNAVTILISADFLKIDLLVRECTEYFVANVEEISKVSVDMGCINSHVIRDIANKLPLDKIDSLKERKNKFVSRLFMKKLELLLEKERNYLYKCAYCNKLFTTSQRKLLHCPKGK